MLLDTSVCDFGWAAPDFTLADPSGKMFKMFDHLGDKGLLVAFICNHCPYVKTIGTRLAQGTVDLLALGTKTLAVMSNDWRDHPEDSPENMTRMAAHFGWKFPYLVDRDQSVGKSYGAVCTPDFFGLDASGTLQYRGRLEGAGMGDPATRARELVDAMMQIAQPGQGPRDQIPSMGCSIKWS